MTTARNSNFDDRILTTNGGERTLAEAEGKRRSFDILSVEKSEKASSIRCQVKFKRETAAGNAGPSLNFQGNQDDDKLIIESVSFYATFPLRYSSLATLDKARKPKRHGRMIFKRIWLSFHKFKVERNLVSNQGRKS